jgi:hypothetical protein
MMKRRFVAQAAPGLAAVVLPSLAAAQTVPPMGGGYTNVTIPVDDLTTKAIAGALFKPTGAGPFAAVVYMVDCGGLWLTPEMALEKNVIDHFLARGVATLIVDPFTPRNEFGICDKLNDPNLNEKKWAEYATRGGNDAVAAVKVLRSVPDIDPNRIYLQATRMGRERRCSLWTRRLRERTTPRSPGSSRTILIA